MGNRHYGDMARLRRDVEALIDAHRYRLTAHARLDHPDLSEADKVAIIRHGGNDKPDREAPASRPKYLCWARHPTHGLCRGVFSVEDTLTGDVVVIITAFPE